MNENIGFDGVDSGYDNGSSGGCDGDVDDKDDCDAGVDDVDNIVEVAYDDTDDDEIDDDADADDDDDDTLILDDGELDTCRLGSKHSTSLRIFRVCTSMTNSWTNSRYANARPGRATFGTTPTINATVVPGMLPLCPDQQVSTARSFTQRLSMASRPYCL